MRVSINQPAYMPWLGYFDRIVRSDVHVVLDTVEIELKTKTAFTNRNKVRTANGWAWITVPIRTADDSHPVILDAQVDHSRNWPRKHHMTIQQSYSQARYFHEHAAFLDEFYVRKWSQLVELLRHSSDYLVDVLGITTPMVANSELGITGEKGDLVLNICKELGATVYLSGPFGRSYLDFKSFAAEGIDVEFYEYKHPQYEQVYSGFEPYMSIIDLLLCHGPEALDILTGRDV